MKKSLFYMLFITLFIIFNGCENKEGEDVLSINNMLDNSDFIGVINKLESKSILKVEDNIALGAAYMGKAGLSFSSLITILVPDEVEEDNDDKAFVDFTKKLEDKIEDSAILDLQNASKFYLNALGDKTCKSEDLTLLEKDICLYQGIVSISKASSVLTTLTDDIASFGSSNEGEDINVSDPKLTASTCAMLYAFSNELTEDCIVTEEREITFIESGKSYTPLTVVVKTNKPFIFLMDISGVINQTIVTKNYCTLETFSSRVDNENLANSFPCPLVETKDVEDVATLSTLVDVLNSGLDSVTAVSVDDDIQEKINDFRAEVALDGSSEITEEDIIKYLEENN